MSRRKVQRQLHDAFESDVDPDITQVKDAAEAPPDTVAGQPPDRELIEHLPPSQMMPDRFQPRPIVPLDLHNRFFGGELDCYQVAAAWLDLAREDAGHKQRVDELVAMAESVETHGQIKAVTGSWTTDETGEYVFIIETGERRFWGACLGSVVTGRETEPVVRVEAVARPSVERQIVENRHAEPPTAVAQAREIAALLLAEMGHAPDETVAEPYAYFRRALDPPGRKRLPRGLWGRLEKTMRLSQRRMRQVLSVLDLSSSDLELADRYGLSDRVLQAILAEPAEQRSALLRQAIEQQMTGDEVAAQTAAASSKPPAEKGHKGTAATSRSALRGLRGFVGAIERAGPTLRDRILDEIADEVIVQENAAVVLSAVEELSALVRVRLDGVDD